MLTCICYIYLKLAKYISKYQNIENVIFVSKNRYFLRNFYREVSLIRYQALQISDSSTVGDRAHLVPFFTGGNPHGLPPPGERRRGVPDSAKTGQQPGNGSPNSSAATLGTHPNIVR